MENKSIWKYNIKNKKYPSLNQDIRCDVLIIGGGITGLTTAYFLKDINTLNTVLIDKDMCGMGISAKSTGKLTIMQDLIYDKISKCYDTKTSLKYLNSQKEAIKIVRDIILKYDISCNYDKSPSYVFTNDINKIKNFDNEISFYKKANIKYKVKNYIPLDYPSIYSLKINTGGVFNPVKYLLSLREIINKNIKIYEDTKAIKIYKRNNTYLVHTDKNYIIYTKTLVVSTHYPIFILKGLIPFKTHVEKSYLLCASSNSNKGIQLLSNTSPKVTIRYHTDKQKNYIIYGGYTHNINNIVDTRDIYKNLISSYKENFSGKIKCYWSNHDIMSYDNLPYIGKIDENLYIATAYNKWGNTNGTIAGKIITDLILNKNNPYINLFNPARKLSKDKIKNLIIYNYKTIKRYILNKLSKKMTYYDNTVKIKKINNILCGIYIDKEGIHHIVKNTCPHMKCNLIFNYKDKTWDCPCHGSRFDIDGNVLFGPSVYNIKIDNN